MSWVLAALGGCVAGHAEPRFDGPITVAHPGRGDQHHATVALRPDGRGLVTLVAAGRVLAVPVVDGVPGPVSLPFGDRRAHHPQVLASGDAFELVAVAAGGSGLRLADLDAGGVGDSSFVATARAPLQPDLAPGLVMAGGEGALSVWTFDDDLLALAEAPSVPLTEASAGTPAVRATAGGWVAAWSERGGGSVTVTRAAFGGAVVEPEILEAWDGFDDDARPSIAVGPSGEAVAWRRESLEAVWIRFLDPDGDVVDEVVLDGGRPVLAAVGDVVLAAWERRVGDRWTVALRAFDLATGAPLGPERQVDGDTGRPARPALVAVPAEGGVRALVGWEALAEPGRREVRLRSVRW